MPCVCMDYQCLFLLIFRQISPKIFVYFLAATKILVMALKGLAQVIVLSQEILEVLELWLSIWQGRIHLF